MLIGDIVAVHIQVLDALYLNAARLAPYGQVVFIGNVDIAHELYVVFVGRGQQIDQLFHAILVLFLSAYFDPCRLCRRRSERGGGCCRGRHGNVADVRRLYDGLSRLRRLRPERAESRKGQNSQQHHKRQKQTNGFSCNLTHAVSSPFRFLVFVSPSAAFRRRRGCGAHPVLSPNGFSGTFCAGEDAYLFALFLLPFSWVSSQVEGFGGSPSSFSFLISRLVSFSWFFGGASVPLDGGSADGFLCFFPLAEDKHRHCGAGSESNNTDDDPDPYIG